MPVYKFKSFEEAEKALWKSTKVDRFFLDELTEFYELKYLLKANIHITKGIKKFLTLEEANKAKFDEILSQNT